MELQGFFCLFFAILDYFCTVALDNPSSGISLHTAKISGFYAQLRLTAETRTMNGGNIHEN